MPLDTTNVVMSGQTSHGASRNPLESILPFSSGILRDLQLFGALVGLVDALFDPLLKRISAWKTDQVFTTSAAGTPLALIAPTSTNPLLLRITSPTDASDILGNTQIQSTDGAGATALARFFPRAGFIIHGLGRLSWSNNAGAVLYGITNVATGLLAAAGTVAGALTDGIYVYRAPGATVLTGVVRRGGVNTQTATIATGVAAGTFYDVGFKADTTGVTFIVNNVETNITLAVNEWPNAAMAATAILGGNARTMDIQRSFFAQEAI